VDKSLQRLRQERELWPTFDAELKLDMVVRIESVMSDLHFLPAGSGDVFPTQ
jgi:hypothetical protein